MGPQFDLILVGAGLANSLIALRTLQRRPTLRIAMLEAQAQAGGNHTWCFHAGDVAPAAHGWLAPLKAHSWPDQEVAFPGLRRRIAFAYHAATSQALRAVLAGLPVHLECGAPVAQVEPCAVTLADGRRLTARAVIDGRGQRPSAALEVRAQKFVGLEVRTARPHGVSRPMIMDADLEQRDGYRFLYLLPFGPNHLLIEDTRYSDAMALERPAVRADALAYAEQRGWEIAEVVREEDGVLPVALGGDIAAFWEESVPGLARSGLAAGLFHPVTGYSFPDAARLAETVATLPEFEAAAVYRACRGLSEKLWRERGYYRYLSRLLFQAADPLERWRVLRRFHTLSEGLIARFYAAELTAADKLRILVGKPPVPISRALACMRERPAAAASLG
jgi:lycopene beta-cyclase